jgi:hypothetical protein
MVSESEKEAMATFLIRGARAMAAAVSRGLVPVRWERVSGMSLRALRVTHPEGMSPKEARKAFLASVMEAKVWHIQPKCADGCCDGLVPVAETPFGIQEQSLRFVEAQLGPR